MVLTAPSPSSPPPPPSPAPAPLSSVAQALSLHLNDTGFCSTTCMLEGEVSSSLCLCCTWGYQSVESSHTVMRVTENTLLRGDNGTWLDLISRRATEINKQDVQFTRLHLSLKKTQTETHKHTEAREHCLCETVKERKRLRFLTSVAMLQWEGAGCVPCWKRQPCARAVRDNATTHSLAGRIRGTSARARAGARPARERYRGMREGGRRRDNYTRIYVEAWTHTVCSQMQFSQGQTVKCPRFIAGGVSALG